MYIYNNILIQAISHPTLLFYLHDTKTFAHAVESGEWSVCCPSALGSSAKCSLYFNIWLWNLECHSFMLPSPVRNIHRLTHGRSGAITGLLLLRFGRILYITCEEVVGVLADHVCRRIQQQHRVVPPPFS